MRTEQIEVGLKEKYGHKLRYEGRGGAAVRRVQAVATNKKGQAIRHIAAEGIWLNTLALQHNLEVQELICCPEEVKSPEAESLLFQLSERAGSIVIISKKTLDSIEEGAGSAGIISIITAPACEFSDILKKIKGAPAGEEGAESVLVIVLDGLEIPGNVGTLVRSADGSDVAGVIITNKKTRLTHPKYIRSSQGSCFSVPVVESDSEEALSWLKSNGFKIYLADTDGAVNYFDADYGGRVAIVLGSERHGISREYYDVLHSAVSIPMFGECDSLNVGIAGTILMYEASLQQKGIIKRRFYE